MNQNGHATDPGESRHAPSGPFPGTAAVAALIAVAALCLVLWRLDWSTVDGLGSRHAWVLLALAAVLQLMTLPLKAVGWQIALGAVHPAGEPPLRTVLAPTAVGALLNLVLAGRVGDAARVLLVHTRLRRIGRPVPISLVVGSAIAETVVSTGVWIVLVASVGLVVPLPPAVWAVIGVVGLGAALLVLAAVRGWGTSARDPRPRRLGRLLTSGRRAWEATVEAHRTLGRVGTSARLTAVCIAGWMAQWGSVYAVLAAFDVASGWQIPTLVLISVTVAQTLPLLPGNLGLYQAAVALPLVASAGVAAPTAVAIGVVLQLVQSLPIAIAGALATTAHGEDLCGLWRAARGLRTRAPAAAR